jgi:hypothetical protein
MKNFTPGTPSRREGFIQRLLSCSVTASASCRRNLLAPLIGAASIVFWFVPETANGQIYVTNSGNGTIGEYNLDGTVINASLISGLSNPTGLVVSGSDLFVVNNGNGTIGEYTTSGATVNASLVSGLQGPYGITVSGSDLFVANYGNDTVGEYTTSGATVSASLLSAAPAYPTGVVVAGSDLLVTSNNGWIGEYTLTGATVYYYFIYGSGLDYPFGTALSGSNLFAANSLSNSISEYTTSGGTVNASLVTGLNAPYGIAVYGADVFVTNTGNDTVGVYNAATGAEVNASLISGLNDPQGIAVVPEPATYATIIGIFALGAAGVREMRRRLADAA